ncbi:MAG: segregation and condensation protein A [Bacteroidota bacterium]
MYRVKLPNFEGPLDLLLFFIKRDELDIYDIPIAKIAKEFLQYVHMMEMHDLDGAGEFLVMASTLMQIKVRMLLPASESEEEEEVDPRADLVRRLLEYKKYKELAGELSALEKEQLKVYYRQFFKADPHLVPLQDDVAFLRNVTLYDLIATLKRALDRIPTQFVHEVERTPVTVEEMAMYLLRALEERPQVTFMELTNGITERIRIVVMFIALLELIKSRAVTLEQEDIFGEIVIRRATEQIVMPRFENLDYGA